MTTDLETRVKNTIAETLGVDKAKVVPMAVIADDLGADSLQAAEVIMALEEEFNCEIPDREAEKVVTVQDAIELVNKHAKEK